MVAPELMIGLPKRDRLGTWPALWYRTFLRVSQFCCRQMAFPASLPLLIGTFQSVHMLRVTWDGMAMIHRHTLSLIHCPTWMLPMIPFSSEIGLLSANLNCTTHYILHTVQCTLAPVTLHTVQPAHLCSAHICMWALHITHCSLHTCSLYKDTYVCDTTHSTL